MLETNGSDLNVERIMYEIRETVARERRGVDAGGSSSSSTLPPPTYEANDNGSFRLQPPFHPRTDNRYHINDLLRFHGADFVRNSYRALLLREPDEIGVAQQLEGLASGRFNKVDVLAGLHASPEGRRSQVKLEGLSLPVAIRRLGRLPLIGYLVRWITAVSRLPLTVQHQNQFEFYLLSQLQRVVDHHNQIQQESKELVAQLSAQMLEGMQRATEQQQAVESSVRQYETLAAQQAELGRLIEARFVETRDYVEHSTTKLTEQIQLLLQQAMLLSKQQELNDEIHAQLQDLLLRQQTAHGELREQERRLSVLLEEVKRDGGLTTSFAQVANEEEDHLLDPLYASFEDKFRGERDEVRRRLEVYIPTLKEAQITDGVLDVGCGRGEWLQLLRTEGIEGRGVDRNRIFVEQCRQAELNVIEADALEYLRSLPSSSLNCVTSFHLVEHLPFDVLIKMLDEISRTLKPGGLVILETPNPENFMVGSCCFYTDPTHRNPIPSQTLQFLLESRGFVDINVLKLRPREEVKLEGDSELVQRFNEYFYSAPDYGIIGRKPSPLV